MRGLLKFIDQRSASIIALLITDIIFFCIAFFAAYYIRNDFPGSSIQPLSVYLNVLPIVIVIMLICFYMMGLYEKQKRVSPLHELNSLIKAISLTALLIMAYSFLQKFDYSRAFVILLWAFSFITIYTGRLIIRKVKNYFYTKNVGINRVLVVGAGHTAQRIIKKLKEFEVFGYQVAGFLANNNFAKNKINKNIKYLGGIKLLPQIIKKRKIQEVYIADPNISHEQVLNLIQNCEDLNVRFKVVSDIFEIVVGDIDLNDLEGIPSLDLKKRKSTPIYDFVKRVIDIILSIVLLIIFAPFWLIITIIIRLFYKNSAIFTHNRVGKNGKIFKIYKFRTMHKGVKEEEKSPAHANDPRVTKLGRFLRKTSIDEIPQVINILKGEMSWVGPRPEMPFIVDKYSDWQRRRLEVKPGLTGLWQILGRKDLPMHDNIEYDFYYIKNRSILLDIIIILKTIGVVITGRGAY